MKGINCNIVKDLLPSYVDKICTEDSRRLIEEHIGGCEQCRTQLKLLQGTELTDEQGEQRRISYLKKLKRHYEKGITSLVLLTLAIIGASLFLVGHNDRNLLYVIFPLSLIAAYGLMPGSPLAEQRSKFSGVLVAGSILASIFLVAYYGYAVLYLCRNVLDDMKEIGPFGVSLHETGPYLEKRLVFAAVAQLGFFVLSNMLGLRGYRIHKSIYGLTLTGFWLATGYIGILHNMSTTEEFSRIWVRMTACLMAEGIICSAAACIFAKIYFHIRDSKGDFR